MIQLLLLLSVSTIACILCNKITAKIGIPMLLAFLCVGMLCGEDGILGISFNDYQLTENVCTAALILIIFYGGFEQNGVLQSLLQDEPSCFLPLGSFSLR